MPQPIARMYDSPHTASAVAEELQKFRIGAGDIHVVQGAEGADGVPSTSGAAEDSLKKFGYSAAAAKAYGEHLARGEAMVVVTPPFGYAHTATSVMDKFSPIAVDLPAAPMTAPTPRSTSARPSSTSSSGDSIEHDATPLSNALGLPVLIDNPSPLSDKFGWRVLKTDPEDSKTLQKVRQQSTDAAPLSRWLGLPLLKSSSEPSATRDSIHRQSEDAAPLSKRFGWRVLLDNPTPLSTRFGWRVLCDEPAPLSKKLGWSVLSKTD